MKPCRQDNDKPVAAQQRIAQLSSGSDASTTSAGVIDTRILWKPKRRFGEHDETDLARETESFERHISKYEQQSTDLISDAIKHGIVFGSMAHQGLK